jgi:hypothetical protein
MTCVTCIASECINVLHVKRVARFAEWCVDCLFAHHMLASPLRHVCAFSAFNLLSYYFVLFEACVYRHYHLEPMLTVAVWCLPARPVVENHLADSRAWPSRQSLCLLRQSLRLLVKLELSLLRQSLPSS